jgi:phosphoglycerate-specific signal transduction histidine kinase
VDELVGRALEAIGPDADRVVVSLPADCPAVRVDAAHIERVLANLVENALRDRFELWLGSHPATATAVQCPCIGKVLR